MSATPRATRRLKHKPAPAKRAKRPNAKQRQRQQAQSQRFKELAKEVGAEARAGSFERLFARLIAHRRGAKNRGKGKRGSARPAR
jgi:hypothetical protein